jgi:predicted ATPase
MKIEGLRLAGIRCFEDSGWLDFSPRCNIFVGQNNAGKSTLLRGIMAWQGFPLHENDLSGDLRVGAPSITYEMAVRAVPANIGVRHDHGQGPDYLLVRHLRGNREPRTGWADVLVGDGAGHFDNVRPRHQIVPFVARRKAAEFNETVSLAAISQISGTFANLYSRIDLIAAAGHPSNAQFQQAVKDIIGLDITTRPSHNGKEAGFYFDRERFVTLQRMGDGVSEMVALIVEMCLEEDKVFILEEPETNLHPKGLKALLAMVRQSSAHNQFIIATHSNIVVRELATDETTKVFQVSKTGEERNAPSTVREVPRTPVAHMDLLRELGYEFADFDLHDGWLFLEESSAESVIRSVLIPLFAPELRGRLRTFSAGGVTNVEPSVAEFKRLITFVHLEPVYRGRLWVRVDGDKKGEEAIANLLKTFDHLDAQSAATFKEQDFEMYYPARFREKAKAALALSDKAKRNAKAELLQEVLDWSRDNDAEARDEWAESANEQMELLKQIGRTLDVKSSVA